MNPESTLCLIGIEFDPVTLRGRLVSSGSRSGPVWRRLKQAAIAADPDCIIADNAIDLPWPSILSLVREYAPQQKELRFRFVPNAIAKPRIDRFVEEYRAVSKARGSLVVSLSDAEIDARLNATGFTKRTLTREQRRDLRRLLALQNGANFSVPGAGKTTVALAIHLLVRVEEQHLLVVAPKSAFPAWREVIADCLGDNAPARNSEPFTVLSGGSESIEAKLSSEAQRFLITYDQLIRVPSVIAYYLSRNPVHVILDESHRMKAGALSQRGAVLLNLAPLPVRRDVLSGTPMPQQASDLQSQLDFLWPGIGLGQQISNGIAPRQVLSNLYVRTTKGELGLPNPRRCFLQLDMGRGQTALYTMLRSEALAQLTRFRQDPRLGLVRARRSVMRLLQVSTNPVLALEAMADGVVVDNPTGIVQAVLEDGPSPKMRYAVDLARELAREGRKCVIWTIFTDTVRQLEEMLADLNPLTLDGAVPSGESDDIDTREGRLRRFHEDPQCWVIIANPAAASEGISLHRVCHDAIYVDRSYNTTHYLQSIDRIHRLGLDPKVETCIHILQTRAPQGLGSIDHSVSRRLASKLRALEALLDDPDLHQLALDEENADAPIDFDIRHEDLVDLLNELEGNVSFDEGEAV